MSRSIRMASAVTAIAIALGTSAVFPVVAGAQTPATAGFITTLGIDTVAIERVTVTATSIEGDVAIRNPRTRTIHYSAVLDANGHVSRFELTSAIPSAPPGPPVIQRLTTISNGTVRNEVHRSGTRDTTATGSAPVPAGAVPYVQGGTAFTELSLRQFVRSGRDSLDVPLILFGPNHVVPGFARRASGGEIELNYGVPFFARVDSRGSLLALSARATTVRMETARVPAIDFEAVVDGWVSLERAGTIAGPISARDTVVAKVGGTTVWVDYGRPMQRGRTIFGALVPFDSVWRTGANAATQLRTDADLVIGGTTIPAGLYSLWTIPTRRGATLIINRQSGQWGTQYDASQDLARVEMRVESLRSAVEQMTIDITPDGDGAHLRIAWENRRFSVPLRFARRGADGGTS